MSLPLDRAARATLPTEESRARHDAVVRELRRRRDLAVSELPDFGRLREHAREIKSHALDHLDACLERFEERALAAGASVHFASDAAAHNRIVHALLEERGVRGVVKSKSMLTEECGLNRYLEARGIEVVDTDLGERIVQLGREPPSHIVAPAIHRRREEVGALFHRTLGSPAGEDDPAALAEIARGDLRSRFLSAEAGITGVNFAIAETGSLVVCTNEGNADLGMHLPRLHVACMGIEKVLPRMEDLAVFLRLLARSATGQPITVYTSVVTGPRPGGELHIVLVDNGRSRLLADPEHREALACIRCGACLNTCPVYRHSGGHAYGQTVPGPIGAVLAPALRTDRRARTLPFASTLCGSCSAVCPVGIDLHGQLLAWRSVWPLARRRAGVAVRFAGAALARPALFRLTGTAARVVWPLLARRWLGNPASAWLRGRELPPHPGRSFRARYAAREGLRKLGDHLRPASRRQAWRRAGGLAPTGEGAPAERPSKAARRVVRSGREPAEHRSRVLEVVRLGSAHSRPHPGSYAPPPGAGAFQQLASELAKAGGRAHGPVGRGEARRLVESLCQSHGGGRCLVDLELSFELRSGPWDPLDPELAPPSVADTNVFAARGLVGVAEQGAIAVPLGAGAPRAALFLCQHLILVLDADAVEPDLHRALSRLASLLPSGASHVWIAGPSKTADIEQTLVLGAHGPRTLDLVGVRGD